MSTVTASPTQPATISPKCAAMVRAFKRAKAERLVAFPNTDGTWSVKTYTVRATGPRITDVACNCIAGQSGLVCKHAVCAMYVRKYDLHPIRPAVAAAARSCKTCGEPLSADVMVDFHMGCVPAGISVLGGYTRDELLPRSRRAL